MREHELIRAVREYLKRRNGGIEPRPGEVLGAIIKGNIDPQEAIHVAREGGVPLRLSRYGAEKAAETIANIHPRILALLELALEKWDESAHIEGKHKIIELPPEELFVRELEFDRPTKTPPVKKSKEMLEQLLGKNVKIEGVSIRRGDTIPQPKLRVPSDQERRVRKDLEEILEIYMDSRGSKRHNRGNEPLLITALKLLGKDPEKDLNSRDIKELERAIYSRELDGRIEKEVLKTIKKCLDPRYCTGTHIATFAHIAKKAEEHNDPFNIIVSKGDIKEYIELLDKIGYSSSAAAPQIQPKTGRVIAGDVRQIGRNYLYINAHPALTLELLRHLAKKNRKIQKFLEMAGLEKERQGKA